MNLRALLVICLLMPFASSLASADDIDNMCFLKTADGWSGLCFTDDDWTAGWYVYRYGTTWTRNNRSWLAGRIDGIGQTSSKTRTIDDPPRGTSPRNNEPLPTSKDFVVADVAITTHYPDGTTATAISEKGATIVVLPTGHTISFDHATGTQIHTNPVSGEKTTVQCTQNEEGQKRCKRL
ncbi:MAG: hypothetical protein OXE46_15165 [Chloroflexi bacterium]|nr:hypothetical protein [Chloroflexota bacterium]